MAFLKNLFYKVTSMFQKQSPVVQVSQVGWQEEWTEPLIGLIKDKILILETASDIEKFRPDYHSLSRENQIKVFVELIKATCYFESGYNPKSASVDVGTKENKDTWSVGLLQMSVVDQSNYGLRFGYTYDDLLKPLPNLTLGVAVLAKQVTKHGKIILKRGEPGLYWSTLCDKPNGKVNSIIKRVQELKFESLPIPPKFESKPEVETPWRDWFIGRKGWSEFSHDKELSKGWSLTKNCKNFKTVIGKEHAWCGMSLATALNSCGYKIPEQCETALKWKEYGTPIDWKIKGIPKGAIVVLATSHVTTSDKNHAPGEYVVNCLGGNQGNSINVTNYSLSNVAAVRWPVK
ncbi:MAG: transglycosylase SLT domain-containing protein [Pseudobdellovibrionaceae bacterium]